MNGNPNSVPAAVPCARRGEQLPELRTGLQRAGEATRSGNRLAPPAGPKRVGPIRQLFRVFALVVVIAGGLYLLNDTTVGLQVKCRLLGDAGACIVLSFQGGDPVQDIFTNIGKSI